MSQYSRSMRQRDCLWGFMFGLFLDNSATYWYSWLVSAWYDLKSNNLGIRFELLTNPYWNKLYWKSYARFICQRWEFFSISCNSILQSMIQGMPIIFHFRPPMLIMRIASMYGTHFIDISRDIFMLKQRPKSDGREQKGSITKTVKVNLVYFLCLSAWIFSYFAISSFL